MPLGFHLTNLVVGGVTLALLAYEAYTLGNKYPNDTISETIWRSCKSKPYVLFFAGLLCGHLFWCPCELAP